MIDPQNIASLVGANVVDNEGQKIGSVGQIYVDPSSGRPNWATVKTGLFGMSESFVPLDEADHVDGDLRVPYAKEFVKNAPRTNTDGEITQDEEATLYSYYHGIGSADHDDDAGERADDTAADARGSLTDGERVSDRDASRTEAGGSNTVADDVRPEGHDTDRGEAGPARLRKYVVTERTVTRIQLDEDDPRTTER